MRWHALAAALCILAVPATVSAFEATFLAASDVELDNPHDVKLSPDGKRLFAVLETGIGIYLRGLGLVPSDD